MLAYRPNSRLQSKRRGGLKSVTRTTYTRPSAVALIWTMEFGLVIMKPGCIKN